MSSLYAIITITTNTN